MKTPMNVFNTAMKKKKKNRKGFSLVELIVVLVIMAILVAALVPSLVGYIKQARQSNAKDECAAVVSAAQTVASSAFADPSSIYHNNSGVNVKYDAATKKLVSAPDTGTGSEADAIAVVKALAEVPGTIVKLEITDGVVTDVKYNTDNSQGVEYKLANHKGTYTVQASAFTSES